MKWLAIMTACLSLVFSGPALSVRDSDSRDLTQFDQPFLLGDWYLINPNPQESKENYLAIRLNFGSDYTFAIDIQKKDYSVDHWEGIYSASNDTIILGLNADEPQVYNYKSSHNLLHLNGVMFTKALSNSLAGIWSSSSLSGNDLSAGELQSIDLILQPDFVFLFRASGSNGDEALHQGVFYTEGNHLVLMFEDGEHDTQYTLQHDQLTLEVENGSMFAVLDRVR